MKKIIVVGISWLMAVSSGAQTAKEAFLSMPEDKLWDLSKSRQPDLVDLYEANREAAVVNSLGDTLTLENLTSEYLFLNTGSGSLQIIVLSMINESKLYCFIQTACGPVCDSRIEFYSPSWKQLSPELFITPAPLSWFIQTKEDFPALSIPFMQFRYEPESSVLQQINRTPEQLSEEDRQMMLLGIREEVKEYRWNGIRFE